jgi:PAS domain S-box-containing protein
MNKKSDNLGQNRLFFRQLIDSLEDYAVFTTDTQGIINTWNNGAERILGYAEKEILGKNASILFTPSDIKAKKPEQELAAARQKGRAIDERWHVKKNGEFLWGSGVTFPLKDEKKGIVGFTKVMRNLTQQKLNESALMNRVEQQEAVTELGLLALSGSDLSSLMNVAIQKLASILKVEYAKILELLPDGKRLILRSGLGWKPEIKINSTTVGTGKNSQAGFALLSKEPIIVTDLPRDTRFDEEPLLGKHNVISGMSVVIYGRKSPYGVLGVHTTQKREFTKDDVTFLQSVANLLGLAIERKELERQKDDFVGIVSHELKTPVTSVKAYGQVLQQRFKKAHDEKSALLLGKMDAQLDKLTTLIGDLLDITKIESGRLQFHEGFFDFNELIKEVVGNIQLTTDRHKIVLELDTTHRLYGDRERIGQVIINLLTNAIKYSPHSDKIIVKTVKEKKNVNVCVQDFGIGIPKEQQKRVFERFFRAGEQGKETYPGLGLGLFIAAEIIKRQNGEMWVESEEGKGSRFWFKLPLKKQKAIQQYNTLIEEEVRHE